MIDKIVEKLKVLLSNYPSITISDELLNMFVQLRYERALGYCNRDELPNEAATTIAFMCLDLIKDESTKEVKSATEGDSRVEFSNLTNVELSNEHLKSLDRYKQARGC